MELSVLQLNIDMLERDMHDERLFLRVSLAALAARELGACDALVFLVPEFVPLVLILLYVTYTTQILLRRFIFVTGVAITAHFSFRLFLYLFHQISLFIPPFSASFWSFANFGLNLRLQFIVAGFQFSEIYFRLNVANFQFVGFNCGHILIIDFDIPKYGHALHQ